MQRLLLRQRKRSIRPPRLRKVVSGGHTSFQCPRLLRRRNKSEWKKRFIIPRILRSVIHFPSLWWRTLVLSFSRHPQLLTYKESAPTAAILDLPFQSQSKSSVDPPPIRELRDQVHSIRNPTRIVPLRDVNSVLSNHISSTMSLDTYN